MQYKCPVCSGSGKLSQKQMRKYKEDQLKLKDFDSLTKKHSIELREAIIKAKGEETKKQRRIADKQDSIVREQEKQIEKLREQMKKMRQEKKTPQEQGKLTVEEFAAMLREEFTNDDIDTPENSRPDIIHTIKEGGKEIRFVYELKDKETGYSQKDIEQTKSTATDFKAAFRMLVVRKMPKRMNDTHVVFEDNVVVSTIDSAIYLIAIFRKEYIENGVSSIKDLEKFIAQRKEILNHINDLANSTANRREEHEEFFKDCEKHLECNKQILEVDSENIKILYRLVNSVRKENEPILVESPR